MKLLDWLGRLKQVEIVRLLARAAQGWYEDKTFQLGAALSFYAVFAITPLILIAIEVAGMLFGQAAAEGRILAEIQSAVGRPVAAAIQDTLRYTYTSGTGVLATAVSAVVLLVAIMSFFGQLQSALNTIWEVKPKPGRGFWGLLKDRFWSFLVVLCMGALVLAAFGANVAVSYLAQLGDRLHLAGGLVWWRILNFAVSFAFITVALALIYQLLPDARIEWGDVWVGAAASGLLFLVGNYLIGLYLSWSDLASTYGAAGSLVVLLLWVYYSSQVLLFGAEFTQAYARKDGKPIRPEENAESVSGDERARQGLGGAKAGPQGLAAQGGG